VSDVRWCTVNLCQCPPSREPELDSNIDRLVHLSEQMANVPPPPAEGYPDSPESPIPQSPTFAPQLHRSLSNSSHWSAADTPHHHHQGTSYYPRPSSPPARTPGHPILLRGSSGRGGNRSTSVTSSHVVHRGIRDGALGEEEEEEEDQGSDDHDGRRERDHGKTTTHGQDEDDDNDEDGSERDDDDPITLKERQSLINVEHPFGLPIWKPALYKKTRSVTRRADEALHSIPSAQAERHLLPGNIFWVVVFGWWLATVCFTISILMWLVPCGGSRYSSLIFGLGWYLAWPFGKYVEGDLDNPPPAEDEERPRPTESSRPRGDSDSNTIRPLDQTQPSGGVSLSQHATITQSTYQAQHVQSDSWNSVPIASETTSLITSQLPAPIKSYGAISPSEISSFGIAKESLACGFLGKACFWLALIFIIAPLMLLVCLTCWGLVFTIPMAKLNWALIEHLFEHPSKIRFCSAPPAVIVPTPPGPDDTTWEQADRPAPSTFSIKHPRLLAGQTAPSSKNSTVLLCTYRAVGWQYYKYTIGGVNIMFINLLPVVIFAIIDGLILLPMVEAREKAGLNVPLILALITNRQLIFLMSLASVIPLSYFIGMAVASISAQSSIGMGAVINATFGSVIEVILYGIALTQGKGHLVEGSIVGSLLAGVLLMPGVSMCSGALRRKEQKFNAKSAGVTSMMLIMAFIGTLTPTLFYQTYGSVSCVFLLLLPCFVSVNAHYILSSSIVSTRLRKVP
jgi:Ca2+:H+ antiporter